MVALLAVGFAILGANDSTGNTAQSDVTNTSNPVVTENSSSTDSDVPINEKATVIERNENRVTSPSANKRQQITPMIVYAGIFGDNLEISAYAPVVETGGSCTATVTNIASGKSTTEQSSAVPSASTTGCGLLVIPVSQLDSGNHSVTVSYVSDRSEGVSSATEVAIP